MKVSLRSILKFSWIAVIMGRVMVVLNISYEEY